MYGTTEQIVFSDLEHSVLLTKITLNLRYYDNGSYLKIKAVWNSW